MDDEPMDAFAMHDDGMDAFAVDDDGMDEHATGEVPMDEDETDQDQFDDDEFDDDEFDDDEFDDGETDENQFDEGQFDEDQFDDDETDEHPSNEGEGDWICGFSEEEIDGPDAQPCCERCDSDTGRCAWPVRVDEEGSGSGGGGGSGRGAAGSASTYPFTDRSVRGGGASPYGPERSFHECWETAMPRSGSPPPKAGPGRSDDPEEADDEFSHISAYERAFDRELADKALAEEILQRSGMDPAGAADAYEAAFHRAVGEQVLADQVLRDADEIEAFGVDPHTTATGGCGPGLDGPAIQPGGGLEILQPLHPEGLDLHVPMAGDVLVERPAVGPEFGPLDVGVELPGTAPLLDPLAWLDPDGGFLDPVDEPDSGPGPLGPGL